MYTAGSILESLRTLKVSLADPHLEIQSLEYDSRKIRQGEYSLFFALKGLRDGHRYVEDAYEKGVRNFVLSDVDFDSNRYVDANFFWVEDSLLAMQDVARYHRQHFTIPVIGITGSNGKTIVKEWLHQLLSIDKRVYESPKSYNSQIGVALSLWEVHEDHEIAIIEAGISMLSEMKRLEAMIQPTIGVFTSLGTAHSEGFESKEEKLSEKWQLFKHAKTIIAPSAILPLINQSSDLYTWGEQEGSAIRILSLTAELRQTVVQLLINNQEQKLIIPFIDKASVENVMTCVSVMTVLGYDLKLIQERILTLQPLEMRLKLKKGKNNCSIIDDSYSNDIASLQIALDFLRQQNQHTSKSIILTDFVGAQWNEKLRSKLIRLLNEIRFQKVILIGTHIHDIEAELIGAVFLFGNTNELIQSLEKLDFKEESILIKGARKYELERVSHLLVQKSHDTVLEINLKALEHNLSQYRAHLQPNVKLMVMVKAFSYGSGSFEVANALQFNKVDYLTVAFVDEGVELRQGGIKVPIMVLSPHEGTFDDLLAYKLEPEIYSLRILQAFIDYLKEKGVQQYPIHIKLDTGMHRLGFMEDEMDSLQRLLNITTEVKVQSVFTHLVGAGNSDLIDFTHQQIQHYKRLATEMEQVLGYTVIKHICNTSAITHFPEAHLDMVRLGIGLYGVDMAPKDVRLQSVSHLKTTISQIKELKSTETVGYDRKGVLYRDSVIATVKIGYADGYNRRLGNGVGKMKINGQLVPTIGVICMDMCMLDITDIVAKEGDEVIVFPDVSQTALDIGTIPYELFTAISSRVKRVYFYE